MLTELAPLVFFTVSLVFGVVDVIRSQGQSLTSWGVFLIAAGLLLLNR